MKIIVILLSILALSNKKDIKYCDIKGNVKNPGVYEIKEGYTINDIIKLSGGLKNNSYTNNINLSKKVTDEMVIYINNKDEISNIKKLNNCNCDPVTIYKECDNTAITSPVSTTTSTTKKITTTKEITTTKIITSKTTTNAHKENIININKCTYEDLLNIKGLGPSKAEKIIEYRNTNGLFKNIEDIMNVKGIGESLFDKIKDFIEI